MAKNMWHINDNNPSAQPLQCVARTHGGCPYGGPLNSPEFHGASPAQAQENYEKFLSEEFGGNIKSFKKAYKHGSIETTDTADNKRENIGQMDTKRLEMNYRGLSKALKTSSARRHSMQNIEPDYQLEDYIRTDDLEGGGVKRHFVEAVAGYADHLGKNRNQVDTQEAAAWYLSEISRSQEKIIKAHSLISTEIRMRGDETADRDKAEAKAEKEARGIAKQKSSAPAPTPQVKQKPETEPVEDNAETKTVEAPVNKETAVKAEDSSVPDKANFGTEDTPSSQNIKAFTDASSGEDLHDAASEAFGFKEDNPEWDDFSKFKTQASKDKAEAKYVSLFLEQYKDHGAYYYLSDPPTDTEILRERADQENQKFRTKIGQYKKARNDQSVPYGQVLKGEGPNEESGVYKEAMERADNARWLRKHADLIQTKNTKKTKSGD